MFFQYLPEGAARLLRFWHTLDARWVEADHPRNHGKFAPKGQGTSKEPKDKPTQTSNRVMRVTAKQIKKPKLTPKERAKVEHEINTLYHSKYSKVGQTYIHTTFFRNVAYKYYFVSNGFNSYEFLGRIKSKG